MKKINNKTIMVLIALISLLIGMFLATISFHEGFNRGRGIFASATSSIKNDPNVQTALEVQNAFRLVVKLLKPTVVNISTEIITKPRFQRENNPFGQFFGDDFFEYFFGPQKDQIQKALGSGVIIDKDGYILSNFHVVENASKITVKLANGKEYKAEIVGTDRQTDLALLKIKVKGDLEVAPIGDSDELEIGDWAIAIGHPWGLDHTFTVGIISAKGRSGIMNDVARYENYIQTDAAINQGNSGGPLVNIKGEVIGISVAILSPSGGNIGLGFAIPVNMAKSVFLQLKEKGKVTRGYLGVSIQNLSDELAKHFDRDPNSGVLISDVFKKSAADKAGIQIDDIIVKYNGKKIKDTNQLRNSVAETMPGKKVEIVIIRDGKEKNLTAKVGELPTDEDIAESTKKNKKLWLGLKADEITSAYARRFDIDEDETGVIITFVEPGSTAARVGLIAGDIIKRINKVKINSSKDLNKFIDKNGDNDSFLLLIKRGGRLFYLSIDNEKE